ncbi:SGNH hydrolase superfamily [Sesbania bispinosa]|nr:SGNH hydrolase superfamily [Sesbania bispinosa]
MISTIHLYGMNFASAGAGTEVGKQLRQKLGGVEAKKLLSRAVYIFSIGGNDYGTPFLTNSTTPVLLPYPQQQFVDFVTGTITVAIKGSALARLHNNALSKMLQKLQKQLKGFRYSITDFYGSLIELMKYPSKYGFKEGDAACCGGGPYRGDYSCGGKRGIEEYEVCNNVNEYVFFDALHPTESAANHFANLMWSG